MELFERSLANPILAPSGVWWEARGVLNPGAALVGDRVAIVYRAVGADGISRFGLAWSDDGERIARRFDVPWYEAPLDDPLARLGVEDPRIAPLDGAYYLTYTQVSLEPAHTPPLAWEFAPFRLRSTVGRTADFSRMEPLFPVLPHTNTKDTVLFPERVGERYAALTRIYPAIQYITSPDLRRWSEPITILEPIPGTWEGERIGAGPPPLRTPWGWLLLYHGNEYVQRAGNRRLYRTGLAVLDYSDPTHILYRHPEPVFSPEAPYEIEGPVGNVVFATGLVEWGGRYLLYYGAGDGVIGFATASKITVASFLREHLGEPVVL